MAVGAASLKKTSWYRNIIILLGVEEHPKEVLRILPRSCGFMDFKKRFLKLPLMYCYLWKCNYFFSFHFSMIYVIPSEKKISSTFYSMECKTNSKVLIFLWNIALLMIPKIYLYVRILNWGCRRGWDQLGTSKIFIVPTV